MSTPSSRRSRWLIVIAALGFLLIPLVPTFTAAWYDLDFWFHWDFVQAVEQGNISAVPHPFYHLLVIAVKTLLPFGASSSPSLLMTIPIMVAYAALLVVILTQFFREFPHLKAEVILLLGGTLLIVSPIYLGVHWGQIDYLGRMLLGYLHPTTYHNPTQPLMRTFALVLFLIAVAALQGAQRTNWQSTLLWTMAAAALSVMMVYSKPNYSLVLVPSLVLVMGYRWLERKAVNVPVVLGIVVPLTLVLVSQYVNTFENNANAGLAIGFSQAVFTFIQPHELPPRLLLSVVFPMTVYALYFQRARQDFMLNVALLGFVISLGWGFFTYETGSRFLHLNQFWTMYAALFVWMYACLVFVLRQATERLAAGQYGWLGLLRHSDWRLRLALAAYGLHAISGVSYAVEFTCVYLACRPT